jgi:hypothetical protein
VLWCLLGRQYTAGKWVVSIQWVLDCLKQQTLLPEESYEVTHNAKASVPDAPRRARLDAQRQVLQHTLSFLTQPTANALFNCDGDVVQGEGTGRGIFSSVAVLLYGHFPQPGPAKCDIAFLLARGGATLCSTAQEAVDVLHSTPPAKPFLPVWSQPRLRIIP